MPVFYGNQLLDDDQIYLKLTDTTPLNSATFSDVQGQSVFAFDYVRGLIDVKLNGKRLKRSAYTATNGTSVTLATPIASNYDVLTIDGFIIEGSQNAAGNFLAYGGTANAITLTSNNAQPAKSYKDGAQYKFRATATNTGAATISVDGLPAKACKTITGAALASGHIRTDIQSVATYYSSTDSFVVVSDVGALSTETSPGAVVRATPAQALAGTPNVIPDAEQVRRNHVAQVATIADLVNIQDQFDGQIFSVKGTIYRYDAGLGKALHNGVGFISKTVPYITDQLGVSVDDKTFNWMTGSGETDPSGYGVFVCESEQTPSFSGRIAANTASEKPREVRVVDGVCYVINQANVSPSPSQPTFQAFSVSGGEFAPLSTINIGSPGDDARAFDVSGYLVYITTFGKGAGLNELYIYDYSNPKTPVLLSTTVIGENCHSIRVMAGIAFLTEYSNGAFSVWDVSDPGNVYRISQTALGQVSIIGNDYSNGYWYSVTNTSPAYLLCVDARDVLSPVLVSTTELAGTNARHIRIVDQVAYIACISSSSIDIVDISNKALPVIKNSISVPYDPGNLSWLSVVGDNLFSGGQNLIVWDVSDITSPYIIAVSKSKALSFDFVDDFIFCADYTNNQLVRESMNWDYNQFSTSKYNSHRNDSAVLKSANIDRLYCGFLDVQGGSAVDVSGSVQTLSAGVPTIFKPQNVNADTLNEFSVVDGAFIAKNSGSYLVNMCATVVGNPTGGDLSAMLLRNGVQYRVLCVSTAVATRSISISGSCVVRLEKGQNVQVSISSEVNSALLASGADIYSYLQIQRIY